MKIVILLALLMLAACSPAETADFGDEVAVIYTGKFQNGTVFDSNVDSEDLLRFTVGDPGLIVGFTNGVRGMRQGQTRSVEVEPQYGYGLHDPELVMVLTLEEFEEDFPYVEGRELGRRFSYFLENGRMRFTSIADINETHIVLDANNPLAGKILIFEIELVELIKNE
ncbi:MAG: FKBP-type peptidyl-prolyl cis-trans isomerase [Candidatus Woesearchaeota archaeon]